MDSKEKLTYAKPRVLTCRDCIKRRRCPTCNWARMQTCRDFEPKRKERANDN